MKFWFYVFRQGEFWMGMIPVLIGFVIGIITGLAVG